MSAPIPTPNYIALANVEELIGEKVLFSDSDRNAITTSNANMLISAAESVVLRDLAPYYITVPALITLDNGSWETLPASTYNWIYNMFVYQSCLQIIGSFIAKNTDRDGTLSYFQRYYYTQYDSLKNYIVENLPNGAYKYQLIGLTPLVNGIPRTPARYAATGNMGNCSYTTNQMTNPRINWPSQWGRAVGQRGKK